jgi:hypothetical protein
MSIVLVYGRGEDEHRRDGMSSHRHDLDHVEHPAGSEIYFDGFREGVSGVWAG